MDYSSEDIRKFTTVLITFWVTEENVPHNKGTFTFQTIQFQLSFLRIKERLMLEGENIPPTYLGKVSDQNKNREPPHLDIILLEGMWEKLPTILGRSFEKAKIS